MDFQSTQTTTKLRLRQAIGSLDMATLGTPLPGMLARGLRLVGDKLPQLVKSPSRHAGALRLAEPDAIAEALEVFEGNSPDSAFSLLNDALGGDVIDVSAEVGFFARASVQLLADALAAAAVLSLVGCRLQLLPQHLALEAHAFHIGTRVLLTVRVGDQVRHAEVHAEEVVRINRQLIEETDRTWSRLVHLSLLTTARMWLTPLPSILPVVNLCPGLGEGCL